MRWEREFWFGVFAAAVAASLGYAVATMCFGPQLGITRPGMSTLSGITVIARWNLIEWKPMGDVRVPRRVVRILNQLRKEGRL